MTVSRTYNVIGQVVQAPELSFTEIYSVSLDGLGLEQYTDNPNRSYIYNSSLGKITFPIPGEKAHVIFKNSSGIPTDPTGVCVPPVVTSPTLPNGRVNVDYLFSFIVAGSSPLSVVVNTKPDWMDVTLNNVFKSMKLSGTPTDAGTFTVDFEVQNECGSDGHSQNIEILDNPNNLQISTTGNYKKIISVTGISYIISEGSFPMIGTSSVMAVHNGYAGVITVTIAASSFGWPYPSYLRLSKNGSLLESLPVSASGDYSFSSQTFLSTDFIQISLTI